MPVRLAPVIAASGFALAAGPALAQADGATLFLENCSACHQAHGQGVAGAFPALAGDAFVQGDPRQIAALLLHGRGGMPNFSADLSDAQIAAILTYVRASFGNHAGPVDVAAVAAQRSASHAAAADGTAVLPGH
jgi:mono/diheme cytochrome c family protein